MRAFTPVDIVFPLLLLLLIGVEVWRNYYIIEVKKKRPNYLLSNILRVVVLILLNFLYERGFSLSLELSLLALGLFAVLFDPILNLSRGKPLLYYNYKTGAWLETLIARFDSLYGLYLFLEILFLLVVINIYVVGWYNFVAQVNGTYNWNNYIW